MTIVIIAIIIIIITNIIIIIPIFNLTIIIVQTGLRSMSSCNIFIAHVSTLTLKSNGIMCFDPHHHDPHHYQHHHDYPRLQFDKHHIRHGRTIITVLIIITKQRG